MHIAFIEIANFRKLFSVRIDLADSTTLFVGANNSGKTSAMLALRRFLSKPADKDFEIYDITLCHWHAINVIGDSWLNARVEEATIELNANPWTALLPHLDLWLQVEDNELHYVSHLIPTLDWDGGLLGVRLRLEPKDPEILYKDFLTAIDAAKAIKTEAANRPIGNGSAETTELTVWPTNLINFLERKLKQHFVVRAYVLDPSKINNPVKGQAQIQDLPPESLPIESNALEGLIRFDEISAQRGFSDSHDAEYGENASPRSRSTRLSNQLRDYWKKHLDPTDYPDPSDIDALQSIEAAQGAFDKRLAESFSVAFKEVEELGYPGVTDPRPRISTKLQAIDGLNHAMAVTFEVDTIKERDTPVISAYLPENNNGLGYQNLISMIFRLMSYRDAWMRVGKAAKDTKLGHFEPLHLVLVEEPEAHLHAQVQQVFIKKAYGVLRAHSNLREQKHLRSQLIVSTHSSHIAHETSFDCLRYFRRLPAGMGVNVPISTVINLSEVFGDKSATEQFVTRYLRVQHADLFFADAAIMVEGSAERMLLPNFIREHHQILDQCYISILEIGGSHAYRLKNLIEHLGLATLIITDLDATNSTTRSSETPMKDTKQVTSNSTLKEWLPKLSDIDDLIAANEEVKTKEHDQLFAVRVAYQMPIKIRLPKSGKEEMVFPRTFEDAFIFENLDFFSKFEGSGLIKKFQEITTNEMDGSTMSTKFLQALKDGKKAEFALDIIGADGFENLNVPAYISIGLAWLETLLKKKQVEILTVEEV